MGARVSPPARAEMRAKFSTLLRVSRIPENQPPTGAVLSSVGTGRQFPWPLHVMVGSWLPIEDNHLVTWSYPLNGFGGYLEARVACAGLTTTPSCNHLSKSRLK